MINNKGVFKSSGNLNLFYQSWLPDNTMAAVVVIVHGGGDHSGRYTHVAESLVSAGSGIYMFDLRGHGRSPGKRGHINSWGEYRDDLSLFLDLIHTFHPDQPLFLFGHSMGAVIVLDHCLRVQTAVTGVICTSPAIGKLGISPVLFRMAKIMNKFWPSLVIPNGLVVSHLSRDKAFILKTKKDPLYHTLSTPRFGIEMLNTVDYIQTHASSFHQPLYLIHGSDDRIASIEGSRNFLKKTGSLDITYKEYPEGYHELFNDLDKEQVLNDMNCWIKKRRSV